MVAHAFLLFVLIGTLNAYENRLDELRTVDDYLNTCPNATYHKKKPSPEPTDDHICTDWANFSCCEHKTMKAIQDSLLYKFNHSHCKPMSKACMDMFSRELCFYECSPDSGPWLVKTKSTRRLERSYLVPLCEEDCNMWWEACKNEQTCVKDWSIEFEWPKDSPPNSRTNECPENTKCQPFSEVYDHASDFCHAIWDGGWRVENSSQCMHFVTSEKGIQEHNRRVARQAAEEILRRLSGSSTPTLSGLLCFLLLPITLVVFRI